MIIIINIFVFLVSVSGDVVPDSDLWFLIRAFGLWFGCCPTFTGITFQQYRTCFTNHYISAEARAVAAPRAIILLHKHMH